MSDIKFLTVFDDEKGSILNGPHMYGYKLAYLPVFYKHNDEAFIDGINSTARQFFDVQSDVESFGIDSGVFQHVYELTAKRGYKMMIVICPSGKYSPYYKEAIKAKKRYLRNCAAQNNTDIMDVCVFDSHSFGIAPIQIANKLADMYSISAMPEDLLLAYTERFISSAVTYVLTACENSLDAYCNIRAYRVTSKRIFELNLHSVAPEIKINNFLNLVSKAVNKNNGKFVVSSGDGCVFTDIILNKLKSEYGLETNMNTQYSIPTTKMLGLNTICIHIGEYIDFN